MMKVSCIWLFGFLLVVSAFADGLAVDGHVNGDHIDLHLTPFQSAALRAGGRTLALTDEQRSYLTGNRPQARNVRSLQVFRPDVETCTCELADVGLFIAPSTVEVKTMLLGRNVAAEGNRNWEADRKAERERYIQEGTTISSPDVQMMKRGESLHYADDNDGAIRLLESARRMNPRLKSAIIPLRNAYSARIVELRAQKRLVEALALMRKELVLIDPADDFIRPGLLRRICKLTAELSTKELEHRLRRRI